MKNYKEYFRAKKVTCLGLGLLGGMLNDALFLLDCGADLTITDLKSEKELASSLNKLNKRKSKNGSYRLVLGRHDLTDFQKADFIIQPGNIPPDSLYLLEAQKNNIPIYESESLFFQYLPAGITTIGVTGTRGKTTTTRLIYEILKSIAPRLCSGHLKTRVFLGGNIQGKSTLALLKDVRLGDIVVMELDSWCLHGLGEIKKSPNISVFTNFMSDHLNFYLKTIDEHLPPSLKLRWAEEKYFADKAQIYLHQTRNDFLICGEKIAKKIGKVKSHSSQIRSKFDGARKIIARVSDIPKDWKIKILGDHNLENIACAIKAVDALFKLSPAQSTPWCTLKKVVENFGGVEGRLQFIKNYKGIKIYNDTTATTPEALEVALKTLRENMKGKGRLITISGGADKKLDNKQAGKHIIKYADYAFLLNGSGTDKIKEAILKKFKGQSEICNSLKLAVNKAFAVAKKGDVIVLSPGFASFGMFKNEYDRGDQFKKLIHALK